MAKPAIAWCPDPDEEAAHPRYRILSPKPNQPLRAFPLAETILGCWTHFTDRTLPCFNPATCSHCLTYRPRHWKGYLAAAQVETLTAFICEITPPTKRKIRKHLAEGKTLLGHWFELKRRHEYKNSRLDIEFFSTLDAQAALKLKALQRNLPAKTSMPPAFEVWRSLLAMWGFAANQFAELQPTPDNA
jgi:hypothetical protein